MTLLEILVKELPGKGGWPGDTYQITQDYDGEIWAWRGNVFDDGRSLGHFSQIAENHRKEGEDESYEISVTLKEFEVALAESKKVEWSGEGLPPVGVNCEAFFTSDYEPVWYSFVAKFIGQDYVVAMVGMKEICYEKDYICSPTVKFRPIRSEEERKRDDAVGAMQEYFPSGGRDFGDIVGLFDAIAAGKIPHVKIV